MITTGDIKTLRTELTASGVFAHRTARSWVKLTGLFAAVTAALALVVVLPWWCALVLVPLAAVPAVTAAMLGHEAAHGSFAASRWHNEIVLHLVFPLFGGLGVQHWKRKHNHLHHGNPNVVGRDPDMNVWPLALSSEEHAASGRLRRRLQRSVQGYLFWPLTFLLAFAMRVESWRHVVGRVRARDRVDGALVADVACLIAHYALWLALPMIWFGAWPVLLVYAGLWATGGFLLAAVFAPAHIGLPLAESDTRGGWRQQIEATRNFGLPGWISWFFVGLDFQIEHHLFPRIPHQNLARASRIVEPWCARVGVPYQRIDYASSLRAVTRHVRLSWQTVPEVALQHSEALETLTVGMRVFYPGHGVARVTGREDREFGGKTQGYYVLELEGDRHAKLMVPVDRVSDSGIRALVSAAKARALMKSIGDEADPGELKSDPGSRKQRATGYNEALRSGSPERYTNTARELLSRFRSGKLSPAEQTTLNQALGMLVGEVSAALDRPLDDVREELRSIAALPATGWW